MKESGVYEDISDFKTLKVYMENQLEDHNMEPGIIPMDLVLFKDAIEHGMLKDPSSETFYSWKKCISISRFRICNYFLRIFYCLIF